MVTEEFEARAHARRAAYNMTPDLFVAWLKGFYEAMPDITSREHMLIHEHLLRVVPRPPEPQAPSQRPGGCGCGGQR